MAIQLSAHRRISFDLIFFRRLAVPVGLFLGYALWIQVFRLISLSLITYFTASPTAHFQDISDAYGSNEVSLMGLASLLWLKFIQSLFPNAFHSFQLRLAPKEVETKLLTGLFQGVLLASILTFFLLVLKIDRYLGYLIQFSEVPIELANIILRMIALGALAYCEEYYFRQQITTHLKRALPTDLAIQVVALFFCTIKVLQFDLGLMHLLTLYLISLSLSYRRELTGNFITGAGFWAGLLIIFHALFSLPIFGNDFSGVILVKYRAVHTTHSSADSWFYLPRLLSGGAGGPLSSICLQALLILDIGRSMLKQKKIKSYKLKMKG